MEERPKKSIWPQQIKQRPVATVLITLLTIVVVLAIIIILGYIFNWNWTGLTATDVTSTPQNITKTIAYSRGEQAAIDQRAKSEREIADDNQREATLKGMSYNFCVRPNL